MDNDNTKRSSFYTWLALLYFVFVVYGSLVPLKARYIPLDQAIGKFAYIRYLTLGIGSRSDLVANFLLFIPLAFFAMGVLTRENARRFRWLTGTLVFLLLMVLSVAIEFTQIYFPVRTVSLNDILAETMGGLAGVLCWFLFGTTVTQWARSLWKEHAQGNLAVKILGGYTVALVIYQLLPFDLTISPVEVYHKLKEGKITLIPFMDSTGVSAYSAAVKMAIVVPIGFLLRVLFPERKGAFLPAGGFVFAAGIEFLQLFVYSRYTSTTDILLGMAGVCVGGWLAGWFGPVANRSFTATAFWQRAGVRFKILSPAAWTIGLAWSRWYPFDFRWPESLPESLRSHLHIPFFYQYMTTEFLAAAQVTREFVIFWILGLLVAGFFSVWRPNSRWAGIGVMILLAIALEGGQIFVPSRVPDLTTIVINITGGILGILVYPPFVRTFVRTKSESELEETQASARSI